MGADNMSLEPTLRCVNLNSSGGNVINNDVWWCSDSETLGAAKGGVTAANWPHLR